MCVINADQFVDEQNPDKVAAGFYNDTYLFDQNACTSPHLVIWTGSNENVRLSRKVFWDHLQRVVVNKKYELEAITAVDKLTAFYKLAIETEGFHKIETRDNILWRGELSQLPDNIDEFR